MAILNSKEALSLVLKAIFIHSYRYNINHDTDTVLVTQLLPKHKLHSVIKT